MSESKPLAIDASQEAELLKVVPKKPILSSQKQRWEGICFQHYCLPAWETPHYCNPYHSIAVHHNSQLVQTERFIGDRRVSEQVRKGDIVILPANAPTHQIWDREAEFSILMLEPKFVAQIAHESIDIGRVEILPHFETPDPLIYQICLALKSELESGGLCSHLYVDSLTTTLAIQLIRQYSAREHSIREYTKGLSKGKLQQVIEYINDHLMENISLKDLAAVVDISSHYFISLFKQSTGLSPHQYLIQCRIKRTKQLLCRQDLSIAEVSQQAGFQNQSHFTNLFRKHTGTTPRIYRESKK
jgi:AraC family transcriptional regulator